MKTKSGQFYIWTEKVSELNLCSASTKRAKKVKEQQVEVNTFLNIIQCLSPPNATTLSVNMLKSQENACHRRNFRVSIKTYPMK